MMIPALAALAGYALGKGNVKLPAMPSFGSGEQTTRPAVPSAWDKVCPVDPSMPYDPVPELGGKSYRDCTREAWRNGTEEDLRALASQIRADYPIAAGTLLLRADDLRKRDEAAAKVTNISVKAGKESKKEEGTG
jgi:hypothetical protein